MEFAMDLKQTFGYVFNRARRKAGLVQEDFEPITSRSYVSYIERGKVSVSMDKLNELSKIIGMHPASLIFQTYLLYDPKTSALDLMATIMEDMKKIERMNEDYE
jgi:transcriptional regulator with XRE-family HTH domain